MRHRICSPLIRILSMLILLASLGTCCLRASAEEALKDIEPTIYTHGIIEIEIPGGIRQTNLNCFRTPSIATLYDPDDELFTDIWDACDRYDHLFSRTIEGSDVWRINHSNGAPTIVDHETWSLIQEAMRISEMTDDAFSIMVGAVTSLWTFNLGTSLVRSESDIADLLPLINNAIIQVDDNDTITIPSGAAIDLDGIAKGYILNRLIKICEGRCEGAFIQIGEDVITYGRSASGELYHTHLNNPLESGNPLRTIMITDCAVITSDTYRQWIDIDGIRYCHTFDPKTGMPVQSDLTSVTIIDEDAMFADAVATACIVIGSEKALALLEELKLKGALITVNNDLITTSYFEKINQSDH